MGEIWKTIPILTSYEVSNFGKIRKIHNLYILKQFYHSRGYKRVQISEKTYYVHRLVALTFIKNAKNLPCVNHIDGDKTNNKITNLEWVTYQQNQTHAEKNNLTCKGSKKSNAKLTENDVIFIVNNQTRLTHQQMADKFKVSWACIYQVLKGIRWSHITKIPKHPRAYSPKKLLINCK